MCRNREIRITWWNRSRNNFRWEYLTSWCCKRYRRSVRNRRINYCWFLRDFVCRFERRSSKIRTFDRFSSMMLTNMLVKLDIEIEVLLTTFANHSNACDFLIWCVLQRFWYNFECRNRKIQTYWRNRRINSFFNFDLLQSFLFDQLDLLQSILIEDMFV